MLSELVPDRFGKQGGFYKSISLTFVLLEKTERKISMSATENATVLKSSLFWNLQEPLICLCSAAAIYVKWGLFAWLKSWCAHDMCLQAWPGLDNHAKQGSNQRSSKRQNIIRSSSVQYSMLKRGIVADLLSHSMVSYYCICSNR